MSKPFAPTTNYWQTKRFFARVLTPISYQQQLLRALRSPASPGLSSGVDFHFTKKRFQMMYHPIANGPRALVKLLSASFLWVALLFCFGQTSYAQTPPPPPPPSPDAGKTVDMWHRLEAPTKAQLLEWR